MKESAPYKKEFIKFIPYLNEIGIVTKSLIKRIEFLYNLCSDLCVNNIEDMFIKDYIKEDGTREYEDLVFFTKTYCLSFKNFLTQTDIIIAPIFKQIVGWEIKAQDFDFKKASEKSRLTVEIEVIHKVSGIFKASRENCVYLQAIINKYIKPNQVPL